MYKKIYIFSPSTQATGGTELLQQLCYKLNSKGQNASMFYTTPYENSPVKQVFEPRYNNPFGTEIEDAPNNIMIVSEAAMYLLVKYKKIQKAVWWLSVDFYGGSFRLPADRLHMIFYYLSDKIYSCFDKKWIHLVQSEYAFNYCIEERHIPENNVYRLSDYLSKAFIENSNKVQSSGRKDVVLYNPKKGYAFTKKLMSAAPEIEWTPIQNMTSDQIVDLMHHSKVYMDFGQHPGKDRIPREAAISGCCVITGLRGAAKNSVDIPIPNKYKFSEDNITEIISMIKHVFDNFEDCSIDYKQYKHKIISEETVFENEVQSTFIDHPHKIENYSVLEQIERVILKPILFAMKFGPTLFGYK